jgi:hypothetical protein
LDLTPNSPHDIPTDDHEYSPEFAGFPFLRRDLLVQPGQEFMSNFYHVSEISPLRIISQFGEKPCHPFIGIDYYGLEQTLGFCEQQP